MALTFCGRWSRGKRRAPKEGTREREKGASAHKKSALNDPLCAIVPFSRYATLPAYRCLAAHDGWNSSPRGRGGRRETCRQTFRVKCRSEHPRTESSDAPAEFVTDGVVPRIYFTIIVSRRSPLDCVESGCIPRITDFFSRNSCSPFTRRRKANSAGETAHEDD